MIKSVAAALLLVAAVAAPAAAAVSSSDAWTSFDGTQGAGGFTYGSYVKGAPIDDREAGSFTQFTSSEFCVVANSICLQGSGGNYPGVYKSLGDASRGGGLVGPADRLLLSPGIGDVAIYAEYTFAESGIYNVFATFDALEEGATGILPKLFIISGGLTVISELLPFGGASPYAGNYEIPVELFAGDRLGFIIDNAGDPTFDATGLVFNVDFVASVVPEPATWSLLITGFAATGFAMRRRNNRRPVAA